MFAVAVASLQAIINVRIFSPSSDLLENSLIQPNTQHLCDPASKLTHDALTSIYFEECRTMLRACAGVCMYMYEATAAGDDYEKVVRLH